MLTRKGNNESAVSESQNDTDNSNHTQSMAECEPCISSMPHSNHTALATANPPPLPNNNSACQYNLITLQPENSAYPYDPTVSTQAYASPLQQETSGCSYDLRVLARENLPTYPYNPAVPAQANSQTPQQETSGYSYNLAAFVQDSLPPLSPDDRFRFGAPDPISYDPFAVSLQPPSLRV